MRRGTHRTLTTDLSIVFFVYSVIHENILNFKVDCSLKYESLSKLTLNRNKKFEIVDDS